MENIDNVIINIVNKVVFKGMGYNIDILRMDYSYCVGFIIYVKFRDIIVYFISYCDFVYFNKKNLKFYNNNLSNNNRVFIYVNEVLICIRVKLFVEIRCFYKEKFIVGCCIIDGWIKMKFFKNGNIVIIMCEDEFYR